MLRERKEDCVFDNIQMLEKNLPVRSVQLIEANGFQGLPTYIHFPLPSW